MNDVKFPINGSINLRNAQNGEETSSARSLVINPDDFSIVATVSGNDTFNVPDAHTSKDEYLVSLSDYGKIGTLSMYSGLSPTEEVFVEDFTWSSRIKDEPGKQVLLSGVDFESLNLELEGIREERRIGSTTVVYSGIRVSQELEGNAYFALRAGSSSDVGLYIEPTVSGADDMNAGRMIFLAKNPSNPDGGEQGEIGFAFMRQSTAINADGYCFGVFTNFSSTNFDHRLNRGEINDPAGFDLDEGFDIVGGTNINWNTPEARVSGHRMWYMLEWDAFDQDNVLIQFSFQNYEDGDSIESIQDTWKPFYQTLDSQSPFTTTSETPIWILLSKDNQAGGDIGVDQLYLEKLASGTLQTGGLGNWKVIHTNNAAYTTRYSRINNVGQYAFNELPANDDRNALPAFFGINNPLVPAEESLVGLDGKGFSGLEFISIPNDVSVSNRAHSILEPRGENLTGITKGVVRVCVRFDGGVGDLGHEFAIGIMRQGDQPNSDQYTVLLLDAGSDQYQIRLRKGPMINNMNISGQRISNSSATQLSSSSTLYTTENTPIWMEVRWEYNPQTGFTTVEVLYEPAVEDFDPVDTSPGNVDSRLTQVLSYTDISSPYTSTTLAPSFYISHAFSGGERTRLYQCEIRRAK